MPGNRLAHRGHACGVRDRTLGCLDDRTGGDYGSGARSSVLLPDRVRTGGESNYELLAPLEGESVYVEHLAANGEGFHYTCIAYPSREKLQDAKAELERQERTMVQSADMGELGEFCY